MKFTIKKIIISFKYSNVFSEVQGIKTVSAISLCKVKKKITYFILPIYNGTELESAYKRKNRRKTRKNQTKTVRDPNDRY